MRPKEKRVEINHKRSTKMRLTGGSLKGKSIFSHTEKTMRPTTSMVRESIFNILRHGKFLHEDDFITPPHYTQGTSLTENATILDIFCGTGVLGYEALSRGATACTFIDQNKRTLELARDNATQLGVAEQARFMRSDSTALPRAAAPVDIVFMDPPYGMALVKPALASLQQNGWLHRGTVLVVEQDKRDAVTEAEGFALLDNRTHDKTRLVIYQAQ